MLHSETYSILIERFLTSEQINTFNGSEGLLFGTVPMDGQPIQYYVKLIELCLDWLARKSICEQKNCQSRMFNG